MPLGIRLVVAIGLGGAYLFVLGWNTLAAAISSMRRTRQLHFSLRPSVAAAAGPSVLPVTLPFVLAWWGVSHDGVGAVFFLLWGLSFWASGTVERRFARSLAATDSTGGTQATVDGDRGVPGLVSPRAAVSPEGPRGDVSSRLTDAESFVLLVTGTLKAWIALALGVALGYGVGAVVAALAGLSFHPPTWARLASRVPLFVLVYFGMSGFAIEILRVQGTPNGKLGLARWSSAGRLRALLFGCLGIAGGAIGIYAGLLW